MKANSTGFSAEELIDALEDAHAGLRDLEEAVEGMDRVPDDLAEAVDRIHPARSLTSSGR